jgi:hypothetical protein
MQDDGNDADGGEPRGRGPGMMVPCASHHAGVSVMGWPITARRGASAKIRCHTAMLLSTAFGYFIGLSNAWSNSLCRREGGRHDRGLRKRSDVDGTR